MTAPTPPANQRQLNLEESMRRLRWHSNELTTDQYAQHLQVVADYPDYLLALVDRKLVLAPDPERNHVLAAIFTDEQARDEFCAAFPKGLHQLIYTKSNGLQLFESLTGMELDGVVFNPGASAGNREIAFVPEFCRLVLQKARASAAVAASSDFDKLASRAFPPELDGGIGPIENLDALWSALFGLEGWLFAVKPDLPTEPYITIYQDRVSIFAFTDSKRLQVFCVDNKLTKDASGEVDFLSIPTAKAIVWLQDMRSSGRLEYVYFNFGGVGWFSPISHLDGICKHLNFDYQANAK